MQTNEYYLLFLNLDISYTRAGNNSEISFSKAQRKHFFLIFYFFSGFPYNRTVMNIKNKNVKNSNFFSV